MEQMPKIPADELNQLLALHFPDVIGKTMRVERVTEMAAEVRLLHDDRHLRPGETISGAALMSLADMAMYAAILGTIGPVLLAVTTNLNINFLRKPAPGDVIGQCRILKLGTRLVVGEVFMCSEGDDRPVAHATLTYSIPPEKEASV